jgi:hypothetical protein
MTAGEAAPAATATLQACEACSINVLFGGGALFEFWASASQHFFRPGPATPVPVGFFTSAESDGTGSGASSSVCGAAATVEAAGGAEGSGGGGSSFLQPADISAGTKNPHAIIATTERSGFMLMFLA